MKNNKVKHMLIGIIFVIIGIVIDQVSKIIAQSQLKGKGSVTLIKDFLHLHYTENTGAAWGIFSGKMWFLYIITIIALGIFTYMLKDFDLKSNTVYSISMVLIITGTLGNFIDRLFRKYVVDFIEMDFFFYKDFPIFNFADMCLTIGVVMLLIDIFFGKSNHLWK